MCVLARQRDPKTRRMMVLGNFSLIAGLLFWHFGPLRAIVAGPWTNVTDGLCGFLFGLSIGINLLILRRIRRCPAAPKP